MFERSVILVSLILAVNVFPIYSDEGSTVITTLDAGDVNAPESADSLAIYREFYLQNQEALGSGQVLSGPVQFDLNGNEPAYLIMDGQSLPYDPYYVPANSLWIQGRSSWTQYMKCPLNARFGMLALSQGGSVMVVERYPDGYQSVQQYVFYPGYTRLVFEADTLGRHTIAFYVEGQASNPVVVDVVAYGGSQIPVNVPQSGPPSHGQIMIDSQDAGFDPNAMPEGYGHPYQEPGTIRIDSADSGFDPMAPVPGEAI